MRTLRVALYGLISSFSSCCHVGASASSSYIYSFQSHVCYISSVSRLALSAIRSSCLLFHPSERAVLPTSELARHSPSFSPPTFSLKLPIQSLTNPHVPRSCVKHGSANKISSALRPPRPSSSSFTPASNYGTITVFELAVHLDSLQASFFTTPFLHTPSSLPYHSYKVSSFSSSPRFTDIRLSQWFPLPTTRSPARSRQRRRRVKRGRSPRHRRLPNQPL